MNKTTFLIVTAVILAGGLGYFILSKNNAISNTPTLQESASQSGDTRTDWGTYRNEEYGFEFGYPNKLQVLPYEKTRTTSVFNLRIGEISEGYHDFYFMIRKKDETTANHYTEYIPVTITTIKALAEQFQKNADEAYTNHEKLLALPPKDRPDEIQLTTIKTEILKGSNTDMLVANITGPGGRFIETYSLHGNLIYSFGSADSDREQLIEIAKTFKFLD
jgi:hypothetical protein